MEVLVILTVLAAGVLWYFLKPYWAVRKVPGPRALPVIGHLHLLAEYGPDVFSLLANRYGPIFRFHMGRQAVVIVANPELCKEVGIKKFKHIPNRSIPSPIASSPLHRNGLFFSRDARWSTMRNAILSVYQPSHLAKLIPTMQRLIESASETLVDSTELDFSDFSLKLATDIIGQAAFGFDFGLSSTNKKNDEQIRDFVDQHIYSTTQLKMDLSGSLSTSLGLLIPFLQNPVRTILKSIPGTTDWKLDRSNEALSRHLDEIVERRKNDRSNKSDFLSLVLDSEKNVFSSENIKAVTYEHLLAGSATTSFTLSSVVYLVSLHPRVERKVLKEIDEFGKKVPTASDLRSEFSYLDSVIKEAMRFYTVSPLVARETSAHVSVGGFDLPEGTWVWLAIGALSKDPRNFPDPEEFRPDRFDPDGEEEKGRHAYANIPFGIGPRACVGQKFSIQEIKLSLIHLYRRFVFRVSPEMEEPPEMEYGLVMRFKHGVKVRPVKRNNLFS